MAFSSIIPNELSAFSTSPVCGLNIPIPEDNCTQGLSHVMPSFTSGSVLGYDVELSELRIIIEHEWELDLRMYLVSPSGTRVTLSIENGVSGTESDFGNIDVPNCESFTAFTSDACLARYKINDPFIVGNFIGNFFPEGDFADFDGENPNGNWTLEICDKISGSSSGTLEFAELIFKPIYCYEPSNVSASNIGFNTVDLNWIPSTPGANVLIEIVDHEAMPGTSNFSPSGGAIYYSNNGSFSVPNLDQSKRYDIYLRESCVAGNFSKNTCVLSIQTNCFTNSLTAYEGFDNQTSCEGACGVVCPIVGMWSNTSDDNFDWLVYQGATESDMTGPSSDFSGNGKYIYIESTDPNCREENFAILESNCMYLNNLSNTSCHMSFRYHMNGFTIGHLLLQIQIQGSSDWISIWSASGDKGDEWFRAWINLFSYNNSFVKFRFYSYGAFNTTGDIALDDISFYGPVDNGTPSFVFFEDHDFDGFGNPAVSISSCGNLAPAGFVNNAGDCDDENNSVYPGAPEITCNGLDDNCSGMADDSFIPEPTVFYQSICSNENTPISVFSQPLGDLYWYRDNAQNELIGVGSNLNTSLNPGLNTIYVKDSVTYGPGLKITEIQLDDPYQLELQSVGVAGDYSDWKVIINSKVAGTSINDFVQTIWELGPMERDEIVMQKNTDWNPAIFWLSNLTGWAMLIDDQKEVRDIVFWNWNFMEMQSFNIAFEGVQYDLSKVPWWGPAMEIGTCGRTSIALVGDKENNSSEDYSCGISSLGAENLALNYKTQCSSNLVSVAVEVLEAPIVIVELDADPCASSNITSAIDIQVFGSGAPFSYLWSNGSISEDQINLPPGNYSLTVTSVNGCSTIIEEISIGQNSATFDAFTNELNNVSCFGINDGMAVVEVTEGTPPFQYNWSIGVEVDKNEEKDTLQNLPAGDFSVTITDNNGCTSETSFTLTEPEEYSIEIDLGIPACQNTIDGSISISVNGGTQPYDFYWSNGFVGSPILQNLSSGAYSLTIEDANGCLFFTDEILLFPDQDTINAEILYSSDVSCFGDSTGYIEVQVIGGEKPLYYNWSNGQDQQDLEEVPAGMYSLTITDANGCTFSIDDYELFQPVEPLTYEFSTISTSCLGMCDGSVLLTANGGVLPYTLEWGNGGSDNLQNDLCNGLIGLTITDGFSCVLEGSDIFIDSEEGDISASVMTDSVLCFGQANGGISLEVIGGVEPYSFDWDKAPDVEDPQSLIAGVYNCTVTDDIGCQYVIKDVTIPGPLDIEIELLNALGSNVGQSEGALEVAVQGGTSPYLINWYNAQNAWLGQGEKIEGLNPGVYRIQLIDFNGCMDELRDLRVENLTSSYGLINTDQIQIFPNPVKGHLNYEIESNESIDDLTVKVSNAIGQKLSVQKHHSNIGLLDLKDLVEGYYIIEFWSKDVLLGVKTFIKL